LVPNGEPARDVAGGCWRSVCDDGPQHLPDRTPCQGRRLVGEDWLGKQTRRGRQRSSPTPNFWPSPWSGSARRPAGCGSCSAPWHRFRICPTSPDTTRPFAALRRWSNAWSEYWVVTQTCGTTRLAPCRQAADAGASRPTGWLGPDVDAAR